MQPPGGGFPSFIQQQHEKGDALKEHVSGVGQSFSNYLCDTAPECRPY